MTVRDIHMARDPDLVLLYEAMLRAARVAEEVAVATNTAIHVGIAGKAVRITAQQLRVRCSESVATASQASTTQPDSGCGLRRI